jgi:hypothetical protein
MEDDSWRVKTAPSGSNRRAKSEEYGRVFPRSPVGWQAVLKIYPIGPIAT